ncbi:phosphoglycerate mutase-like protein [Hypoxylon sp. NC1633]|nr:phosphoglycerate mutase-like protein [Hypoxylon sp. NC1633]
MSLEVIYVVRHGFRSSWSVDHTTGNYTSSIRSPTGLPTDPALVSHGVEQASELATYLSQVDPPIEQVYSSPYYRCMQTIQPFVRGRRCLQAQPSGSVSEDSLFNIRVDLGLSEWFGLAHFEHPSSAPLKELQDHFPELDASYASSPAPSRNGESLSQLHDRAAKAIDLIIKRSDQEGRRVVLVSTHAAVVIALGRILTGEMERDFGAFTCGLSKYRRHGSSGSTFSIGSDGKTGSEAMASAARGDWKIGGPRSEDHSEIDPAAHVDPYPLDSGRPDPGSRGSVGTGLYGGWACELDSDCSFLSYGEERGWKFSGDESFIETDNRGLWPSSTVSRSSTAVDKTGMKTHDSHINPSGGISKL